MLPPVPYLSETGYLARTKVATQDVEYVIATYPGFLERQIARGSSWINGRLQKRYRVPLGQAAPELVAIGTAPPAVALQGRPVTGDLEIAIQIVDPGLLGASTFWWSEDEGTTWNLGAELAATGGGPAVSLDGAAELGAPEDLAVAITDDGALGAALFQWSVDGGDTWNIAPGMAATGTSPPGISLTGVSSLAEPSDVQIQITTAGTLGVALFQWSEDGGATWTTGLQTSNTPVPLGTTGLTAVFSLGAYATNNAYQGQGIATATSVELGETGLTLGFSAGTYSTSDSYAGQGISTAASYVLGETGLTAIFPSGAYSADNVYSASTPVLEVILGWLVAMVDVAVWQKRGANPQDPTIGEALKERDAALAELKETADSKDGLFDLPLNDQVGESAVRHGGPLMYTEASPYVSADRQEFEGRREDLEHGGTYGGEGPWRNR
jgi:hypothetical protein